MDSYNMDESTEQQPTIELDSRQTRLLKLTEVDVGDEVELVATGTVVDVNEYEEDDGSLAYSVTLELRLAREDAPEDEPARSATVRPTSDDAARRMFPSMK